MLSSKTKSITRELNKDWNNYTRKVDAILEEVNCNVPKSRITFIIRRKKGCDDSVCSIINDELNKLSKIIDDIVNDKQ